MLQISVNGNELVRMGGIGNIENHFRTLIDCRLSRGLPTGPHYGFARPSVCLFRVEKKLKLM